MCYNGPAMISCGVHVPKYDKYALVLKIRRGFSYSPLAEQLIIGIVSVIVALPFSLAGSGHCHLSPYTFCPFHPPRSGKPAYRLRTPCEQLGKPFTRPSRILSAYPLRTGAKKGRHRTNIYFIKYRSQNRRTPTIEEETIIFRTGP